MALVRARLFAERDSQTKERREGGSTHTHERHTPTIITLPHTHTLSSISLIGARVKEEKKSVNGGRRSDEQPVRLPTLA